MSLSHQRDRARQMGSGIGLVLDEDSVAEPFVIREEAQEQLNAPTAELAARAMPPDVDTYAAPALYFVRHGGVAQRESACFACKKSGVRIPSPPPDPPLLASVTRALCTP